MPLAKPGRTTHPLKDKLVGECADDTIRIEKLEDKIKSLEAIVIKLAAKAGLVERELSNDEEKEKERLVKGMKKNKSDFQRRYGDDAEEVMYATATKRAKQNASVDYSSDIKNFMQRHKCLPGITGWAQVNGSRGPTDKAGAMDKRYQHDY